MSSRALTPAEVALGRSVFGDAIAYDRVSIHAAKWAFFQPRDTVMAPDGDIWLHPRGGLVCDDFCTQRIDLQGTFVHELTHVWQAQQRGRWWLPLMRHPFCRYRYTLEPGKPFEAYGIEQQAEIVRHAWLLREGRTVPGAPPLGQYRSFLPFEGQ